MLRCSSPGQRAAPSLSSWRDREMADDSSGNLVAPWRQGNQQAAELLFQRYANRLITLARNRIPAKLTSRVDPEDVVQSVYRSFFARARAGRYELQRGGDLWRLLMTITLHKLYKQIRRYQTEKRDLGRERNCPSAEKFAALHAHLQASEPSPQEAATLADELGVVMRTLAPVQRRMLELRLLGYDLDEIAADVHCSERTVIRVLQRIKLQLEQSTERLDR